MPRARGMYYAVCSICVDKLELNLKQKQDEIGVRYLKLDWRRAIRWCSVSDCMELSSEYSFRKDIMTAALMAQRLTEGKT
jgi:hypothetical protein